MNRWRTPALLMMLTAMVAFGVAGGQPELLLIAWPLAVTGWLFTERRNGKPLPRLLIQVLVLGVILVSVERVYRRTLDVEMFCEFLVMILLIKAWDRKRPRDVAQVITLSLFLAIGATLESNELVVGLAVLLMAPLTLWAVTLYQIGAGREIATADGAACGRQAGIRAVRTARIGTLMFIIAMLVSVGVFVIVPRRVNVQALGRFGVVQAAQRTGLTDQVVLGRSGLISESQTAVMQARFRNEHGDQLGAVGKVFYLRAAMLGEYARGIWVRGANPTEDAPPGSDVVVQEIVVREAPQGRSPVPVVYRASFPIVDDGTREMINRVSDGTFERNGPYGRFAYLVKSTLPRRDFNDVRRGDEEITFDSRIVAQQAAKALERADVPPDPNVRPADRDAEAAGAILRWLRSECTYTLELAPVTGGLDPIEWFLTVSKRGNCEYFASAMAAMCRTVGINARVIAGYVAAEFDEATGWYTVRESNAHAWCEIETSRGIWETYDPTPPVDFARQHQPRQTLFTRFARMFDSVNDVWKNSVVFFDDRSQRSIFKASPTGSTWLTSMVERAESTARQTGRRTFAFLVFAGVAGAVVGAGAAFWAAGKLAAWLRARREGVPASALDQLPAWYAHALQSLARRRMAKPAWLTPLRHADAIAAKDPAVAAAFSRLARLCYRVRFGGERLSDAESAEANRLADAIKR